MVAKNVPDHQDASFGLGQLDQLAALRDLDGERLFHKDILARVEGQPRHFKMRDSGRGQGHGLHGLILQHLFQTASEGDPRIFLMANGFETGVGVTNRMQRAQLMKIAHQIFSPISHADHCDILIHLADSLLASQYPCHPRGGMKFFPKS